MAHESRFRNPRLLTRPFSQHFSLPLIALRRGGALRATIWDDVQPCAVHLRRYGDTAHRDEMGLQAEARRLLDQPVSAPEDDKQGKINAQTREGGSIRTFRVLTMSSHRLLFHRSVQIIQ